MLSVVFTGICIVIAINIPKCIAERRITNGKPIQDDKRYMAYLVKAPPSLQKYDAWLCGGAIVTPYFIITSAACIEDVQFMYAIAGYAKYVPADRINENECTRKRKKKIIYTCVPKAYDFQYDKTEKWSSIDIGAVKVESPYNFKDTSYTTDCSYVPGQISINYEPSYQEPGTDAMVLGWGHLEIWRNPSDNVDYNQEHLHYASVSIEDKEVCKKYYNNNPEMQEIINKYMICTDNAGNINDAGELIHKNEALANGCVYTNKNGTYKVLAEEMVECDLAINVDDTRKKFSVNENSTRRNGICQNDHGGPLVTWMGSHQILIGVASVFTVNEDSKCQGPYLFTSTQCNSAFLDCIINEETTIGRRSICNKPPKERGFDIIRKRISWKNHTDGPAFNEQLRFRPQLPIRNG